MDVSVKDIHEITIFGNSVKSFVSDYIQALNSVLQGASADTATVNNILYSMRNRTESTKSELYYAEKRLEDAIRNAESSENPDWSKVKFIEREVEDKTQKYRLAQQTLDEAESIAKGVKIKLEQVQKEIQHGRNSMQDTSYSAMSAISKAIQNLSRYVKK